MTQACRKRDVGVREAGARVPCDRAVLTGVNPEMRVRASVETQTKRFV